jgi:hypothetical protein
MSQQFDVLALVIMPEDKDAASDGRIGVLEMTWLVIILSGLAKASRNLVSRLSS